MSIWYVEKETPGYKLHWKVKKVLHERQTRYQRLQVLELEDYGRALILDNAIQITEKDEFIYNEMIAHVPLLTHPSPKRVLIIGGGDGGAAREVLKHKEVEEVHMVEIDGEVIDAVRKFFPENASAFDDPRFKLFIQDGLEFIKSKKQEYDVIIVDSSDPVGPAVQLFEYQFYSDCLKALKPDGILNVQSESPFYNKDVMKRVKDLLSSLFKCVNPYLACIPTYPSGLWSFTMASNAYHYSAADLSRAQGLNTRYFTKDLFHACFVLPGFINDFLNAV
ncbi:polyamine aminopropyltransferase [Caldicoprobacter algeriensis]|uniref:polyamine aminopropyltransferase n=1 Tax=Caldicoprobacter algeriensis TaxID=699281 RepID=UPI00207971E5|nr:polyamine aminopropyltransferase [Caldicoprobacter algeriensis]